MDQFGQMTVLDYTRDTYRISVKKWRLHICRVWTASVV
jgi:hypothetical protein